MEIIFPIFIFILVGFLYVWYLRLAAKWTIKTTLSYKLCWIFFGIVIAITILNKILTSAVDKPSFAVLGIIAHVLVGAWFFGKFAIGNEKTAPGFVGGIKVILVAMALLGVTCALLFAVSAFFLSGKI